jgi:uncharacterized protein (UPF0276 family)
LILLDINNVYVSSRNHGFHPESYLHGVPPGRVHELHLAGYSTNREIVIDTHDAAVADPVWDLFVAAVRRFGCVATLIERDAEIPPLADLLAELERARSLATPILAGRAA